MLLAGTLGCPHSFGRGGTIDRAVHKDNVQRVQPGMQYECPPADEDVEEFCDSQPDPEECYERCVNE